MFLSVKTLHRKWYFASNSFPERGHFVEVSNEYNFTYVPRCVCGEKGFFLRALGFLFFPRKWCGAFELTRVVCTIFDLWIVPIFWDTKNLLCETINLLRENIILIPETMHTDETSCNVFSMTKYLTEIISLMTVKKSNRHILFKATQYSCRFCYKSTNNQWQGTEKYEKRSAI